MARKKAEETQEDQSRRFVETARELGCDEDPALFERAIRQVSTAAPPEKEPKTGMSWYVSYRAAKSGAGERQREFKDEAGAKKFAAKQEPKTLIRAGTLPGIIPAKRIAAAKIQLWLEIDD